MDPPWASGPWDSGYYETERNEAMNETTKQIATKYADLIMQDNASKSASVPTQFARVHAAIIEATENLTRERDAMQATVEKCRAAGEWREAKHTDTFSHGDLILAAVKIHPLGQQPHWEIGLVRFDSSDNRMKLREMSGNEWRWYWDDVRFWMPVKTPSAAERAKGGGEPS